MIGTFRAILGWLLLTPAAYAFSTSSVEVSRRASFAKLLVDMKSNASVERMTDQLFTKRNYASGRVSGLPRQIKGDEPPQNVRDRFFFLLCRLNGGLKQISRKTSHYLRSFALWAVPVLSLLLMPSRAWASADQLAGVVTGVLGAPSIAAASAATIATPSKVMAQGTAKSARLHPLVTGVMVALIVGISIQKAFFKRAENETSENRSTLLSDDLDRATKVDAFVEVDEFAQIKKRQEKKKIKETLAAAEKAAAERKRKEWENSQLAEKKDSEEGKMYDDNPGAEEEARIAVQTRIEEEAQIEARRQQKLDQELRAKEEADLKVEKNRFEESFRAEQERRKEEARIAEARRNEEIKRKEEARREKRKEEARVAEARRNEEIKRKEEARREKLKEEARVAQARKDEEIKRKEEARVAQVLRDEQKKREEEARVAQAHRDEQKKREEEARVDRARWDEQKRREEEARVAETLRRKDESLLTEKTKTPTEKVPLLQLEYDAQSSTAQKHLEEMQVSKPQFKESHEGKTETQSIETQETVLPVEDQVSQVFSSSGKNKNDLDAIKTSSSKSQDESSWPNVKDGVNMEEILKLRGWTSKYNF